MGIATSPGSTLLVMPGRQAGHVQLVSLSPCLPLASASSSRNPPQYRSPIILAHTHPLSTLACTANGSHVLTTSERGTLLRVWDTSRGRLERELRRGMDRADMWGVKFEDEVTEGDRARKGGMVVGWSDKGTVHVWEGDVGGETSKSLVGQDVHLWAQSDIHRSSSQSPNFTHLLSRNLPLPKYFSSPPSFALYRLPRKNPHAFQQAIGTVAGKAGVTSLRIDPEATDEELSERFVVGWIDVDPEQDVPSPKVHTMSSPAPEGQKPFPGGIGMGTREDRRSFGSEETSRTVTPTPSRFERDAPNPSVSRRISAAQTITRRPSQTISHGTIAKEPRVRVNTGDTVKPPRKEKQLVAITYSGDWYRLRIPDSNAEESELEAGEDQVKKGRCQLMEYRRLGVGGGGW